MKRTIIIPLAMIAAGFAVLSLAKPKFSRAPENSAAVLAVDAANTTAASAKSDLTGEWLLDPSRSDQPGMRGGGGGPWAGRRQGQGGGGMGRREGGPGRRMRLPAGFQITQSGSLVSFADSAGAVLQEIATNSDTTASAPGVLHRLGAWKSGALEVSREGRGGMTFVESWRLENSSTLVVTTHISGGDMGDRTVKRVYRRVRES